jgi:hypothetical protein
MSCCCSGVGAAAERQFSEKRATKDLAQYRTKGPGATAVRESVSDIIHSASAMEHAIRLAGFEMVSRGCTRTWCADVYRHL